MTGPRRKPGRMGPFIEGYRAWLAGRGYAAGTIVNMLAMAGGLGRWMDARGIGPGDLDQAVIKEFRGARRAAGMRCVPGAHGLDPLLEYLADQGVLGEPFSPAAPAEVLAERYRQWLVTGRGLAEATVVRYAKLARLFLGQRPPGWKACPGQTLSRSCWPKASGSALARSRAGWARCARC